VKNPAFWWHNLRFVPLTAPAFDASLSASTGTSGGRHASQAESEALRQAWRLGYAIEHAAYHEAGHAVLALGAKPQFVGRRSDLAVPFVGG
jgi:hypothetical protein